MRLALFEQLEVSARTSTSREAAEPLHEVVLLLIALCGTLCREQT